MENLKISTKKLILYAVLAFSLISLILAILTLFENATQIDIKHIHNTEWAAIALVIQLSSLIIFTIAWKLNLTLHGIRTVTFRECLAHTGIAAAGKYAPGKIVGSMAKGLMVYRATGKYEGVVTTLFLEQLINLHSGVIIVISLFFNGHLQWMMGIIACLTLLMLPLISLFHRAFDTLFKIKNKLWIKLGVEIKKIQLKNYLILAPIFIAHWIVLASVLYFCIYAIEPTADTLSKDNFSFLKMVLLSTSAYIIGITALFSPSGIGVRDGILVASLTPIFGLGTAISIAALHRLICITVDIIAGFTSLIYANSRNS